MADVFPLTPQAVAGLPAVPPAAATRASIRFRRLLQWAHARSGLAFQVLLERALAVLDAPALYALVELGVPDLLDRPRTAAELASMVGAEPAMLERLLAYLASRGCVRRDRRGRYRANRITKLLQRDGGWDGWVRFIGSPWTTAAYAHLLDAVRTGADPMQVAHGVGFFAYLDAHPGAASAFHAAQSMGARLQAIMITRALEPERSRAVLDVGGGTGTLLSHLLASRSELHGAVLDLAAAEVGARANFAAARIEERAEFIAGDFFEHVPEGYDLHVLTAVVHDWNDADATRILRNCAAALQPGGRIVVVETELVPGRLGSFVQSTDALMLAFTPGGRERTRDEFEVLWAGAGLRCARRVDLPSEGTLFELQP